MTTDWTPARPLRADATDEHIAMRYALLWSRTTIRDEALALGVLAREFADARVAACTRAPLPAGPTRETIAGLLSTMNFRPDVAHPSDCLPMADAVLALYPASPEEANV